MTTSQQPAKGLELKLLNFNVSEIPGDTSPHDALQKLLEANDRWGDQFRYGRVESSLSASRELMSTGVAASQPRANDGSLVLFGREDCRRVPLPAARITILRATNIVRSLTLSAFYQLIWFL